MTHSSKCARPAGAEHVFPKEPPSALIESMCLRFRHDFLLDKAPDDALSSGLTEIERSALRLQMRQLYEEVIGEGFYKWGAP